VRKLGERRYPVVLIVTLDLVSSLSVVYVFNRYQNGPNINFAKMNLPHNCADELFSPPQTNLYVDIGANRGDMLFRFFEKRH
jgi:hypothetical protein